MTEEAIDPGAEQADAGSEEARPRRRRRGSRGRGRGGSRSSRARSGSEQAPAGTEEKASEKEPKAEKGSDKETKPPTATARGRSRRSTGKTATSAEAPESPPAKEASQDGESSAAPTRRRRRRRRRRKPGTASEAGATAEPAPEPKGPSGRKSAGARPAQKKKEPKKTEPREGPAPTRAKQPDRAAAVEPTALQAAPTRTSRPARRTATERRRRRPVMHAPRRTDKTMLITETEERLQIAVVEGRDLVEHYVTRTGTRSMVGNVYLGKVQNVLPGMEAAFIDVGRGRNAVLYAGEVSYDEDVEAGGRRIEAVIKPGQSVLVQVTKDPLRGKGARLTAQVSLPGRYLVYVPDGSASGISRRLPDPERERLRRIVKRIRPSEAGVIVRTAAEGATEEDLAADLERLKKTWDSIKGKARRGRAPKALYEEPELTERVVRDVFSPAEFKQIVIDSREVFERVRVYLQDVAPELVDRIRHHDGALPLFEEFHVAEQIHKALERKVWLASGGYVIIDRVEAMTVIDVNTGKHVGKTNLEETVVKTNLEAAEEIARQLRLRDIGGIIVIDFIDMLFERNRAEVIRTFQEALARDKTRSQVFDITPLGLLEITRKKVSAGLLESFSETCPTCEGRGILLTHDVT
jgi:ribonuclease E